MIGSLGAPGRAPVRQCHSANALGTVSARSGRGVLDGGSDLKDTQRGGAPTVREAHLRPGIGELGSHTAAYDDEARLLRRDKARHSRLKAQECRLPTTTSICVRHSQLAAIHPDSNLAWPLTDFFTYTTSLTIITALSRLVVGPVSLPRPSQQHRNRNIKAPGSELAPSPAPSPSPSSHRAYRGILRHLTFNLAF
ncbi:hypothetical protein G7046_g6257 [Stylonectria norvegica]|nr:hypothetical protein G7046_g6257 [Stylonectria norvegica]